MKKLHFKPNKRIYFLIGITILFLLFGFLSTAIIPKELIINKATNYINNLIEKKIEINKIIIQKIQNNTIENVSIYLFTIVYLFPISIILYAIKLFSTGLSISSLIYLYHIKSILYLFPIGITSLLEIIVLMISMYYSLSYFLIKIKYKKRIPNKKLKKAYLKVIILTTILQIIISIIEGYFYYYYFPILS